MEKYCTPEFEFKKVLGISNVTIFIFAVVIMWPATILYGIKGYRYLGIGGMSLLVGVFFLIFTILFNYFSKTVTIYFDRKRMYVKDGEKEYTAYLKRDILGFYSYNYDERSSPFITIKIVLKNGKAISLTDAHISPPKDADKEAMLKQFLLTAKRQLDFTFIKKSRRRSVLKLGALWYSRGPDKIESDAKEADLE